MYKIDPSQSTCVLFTGPCVELLTQQADSLNLKVAVYHPSLPDKPVVVIKWKGTKPNLPSIMLNSHMDVVPVYAERWSHPPFAAEIDDDGKIFARGTQDTKGQGMSYFGAIRKLKKQGFTPKRNLYLTYVPDEEISGIHGMKAFVGTKAFKNMNVGFVIDEGVTFAIPQYLLFNNERTSWAPIFTAKGETGHAAQLPPVTSGTRFTKIVKKLMDYRAKELARLQSLGLTGQGKVTSINLTKVFGGIQTNVIPDNLTAVFDIRIAPDQDLDAFLDMLNQFIAESGGNIDLTFEDKNIRAPETKLDGNPQYNAMQEVFTQLNFDVLTLIFPAVSDARYLRGAGVPTVNFMPMHNTTLLAHADNEYIEASKYIEMIDYFANIIVALTNST